MCIRDRSNIVLPNGVKFANCTATNPDMCNIVMPTYLLSVSAIFSPITQTSPFSCSINTSTSQIAAGGSSTLTANCNGESVFYNWTGGTCSSNTKDQTPRSLHQAALKR